MVYPTMRMPPWTSWQFEALKPEQNERNQTPYSTLSGSAIARRRTYNGVVAARSPTAEAPNGGAFSTASLTSHTSLQTLESYCTATSYIGPWHTFPSIIGDDANEREGSVLRRTFWRLLQRNGLTPLDEDALEEYDWCGRGMHVDFQPGEKVPLEVCDSAGHGSTSSVDIVKCRRIKLARKLTYLTPKANEKVLLQEAQALQKLRHAHVVQLIGTYRQGRKFTALLYPVADMDLSQYLEAKYMPDANMIGLQHQATIEFIKMYFRRAHCVWFLHFATSTKEVLSIWISNRQTSS
jgi:hypothetical protein